MSLHSVADTTICGRISGPLLDRIDIHIDVPAVKFRELTGDASPETDSSATIRSRVINARGRQLKRFAGEKIFSNAAMTPRMIRRHCRIDAESEQMLERAMTRLGLSARAYDRILKVSRTIADLDGFDEIRSTHVSEAVGYRSLDRTYWTLSLIFCDLMGPCARVTTSATHSLRWGRISGYASAGPLPPLVRLRL